MKRMVKSKKKKQLSKFSTKIMKFHKLLKEILMKPNMMEYRVYKMIQEIVVLPLLR